METLGWDLINAMMPQVRQMTSDCEIIMSQNQSSGEEEVWNRGFGIRGSSISEVTQYQEQEGSEGKGFWLV